MVTKAEIADLAAKVGFGGQLRNTHAVKLEAFYKAAFNAGINAADMACLSAEQSTPKTDRTGWEHGTIDCHLAIKSLEMK